MNNSLFREYVTSSSLPSHFVSANQHIASHLTLTMSAVVFSFCILLIVILLLIDPASIGNSPAVVSTTIFSIIVVIAITISWGCTTFYPSHQSSYVSNTYQIKSVKSYHNGIYKEVPRENNQYKIDKSQNYLIELKDVSSNQRLNIVSNRFNNIKNVKLFKNLNVTISMKYYKLENLARSSKQKYKVVSPSNKRVKDLHLKPIYTLD